MNPASSSKDDHLPAGSHERQALLQAACCDVENPHGCLREQEYDCRNEGLLLQEESLIGTWLQPLRCLCSCSWMLNTLQSDSLKLKETPQTQGRYIYMACVVKGIKYFYSLILLGFCLNLIIAGIFADETPVSKSAHPLVAFAAMWVLILWLGMLEGGQGCLVGLQPVDKTSYAESHPITHKCATMVHKGDNLNRFIVGRQFLVVLVVFCLNLCCTVVEDALVPGFSHGTIEIFLSSGLAVMLITVILGQLAAEVNATNCMLDFINTPFMVFTTWVCLAIETSGLLHSVYLVQCFFSFFTDKETNSDEPSRTPMESLFYWARVLASLLLLSYAFTMTLSALLHDQTTMYEGLPDIASVVIFFGLICFLGILEAMQIAVFAVVKLPEKDLEEYPAAQANCQIVFRGQNFKAFLIGRQICVTTCMFLLARITTTDVDPQMDHHTVMNVSNSIQNFFNTGLPGALITTIVASLAWRIVASSFPIPFMANPLVKLTIQFCLLLEASGVFSAAWLLADILKFLIGFKPDDVYIGDVKDVHNNNKTLEEDEEEEESVAMERGYGATTH